MILLSREDIVGLSSNRRASLFRQWRKRFAAHRLISAYGKDHPLNIIPRVN